jgi:hypothetical protein
MINDKINIKGQVASWKLFDQDGNLKESGQGPNLITTVGRSQITALLAGTSTTTMTHMAIGSGTTAAAVGDTALQTELARVAFTSATPSSTDVSYVGTFGPGVGTGTIAEAGLFSAAVGGIMLSRSLSVNLTKSAGDTLEITWTITFS